MKLIKSRLLTTVKSKYISIIFCSLLSVNTFAGPDCSTAYPVPAILDPANDAFIDISINGIAGGQTSSPEISYTCITQSEPKDYNAGLDIITEDATGIESGQLALRARRITIFSSPETGQPIRSNGRLYDIEFRATDTNGEYCTGKVSVEAPLFSGANNYPDVATVDYGFRYNSSSEAGNCNQTEPPENTAITITSLADGDTIVDPALIISGQIQGADANSILIAQNIPGKIEQNGGFTVGPLFLNPGVNTVEVKLYDKQSQQLTASETLTITHSSSLSTGMTIGASGGVVEISDPLNPIDGSVITVPQGALLENTTFDITQDLEHLPALPFEWVEIGPSVSIRPLSLSFIAPVSIEIPIVSNALNENETPKILLLGDSGWIESDVINQTSSSVTFLANGINFGQAIAVKARPTTANQVIILSDPSYSSIYVNGVNTGLRTPAIVDNIQALASDIKLHLSGFNEYFDSVSLNDHPVKKIVLTKPSGDEAPIVSLNQSLEAEFSTTEAELTLSGQVSFQGAPLANTTVIFSLNGRDYFERTNAQGIFDGAVVLARGENKLEIRSTSSNGQTYVSTQYVIHLGSPDLTATLSWNTSDTDIDLHVFSPSGQHASYENKVAIPGGSIDRDDTDGFGPEIFTLQTPPAGVYRFNVDSYDISGDITTAVLQIRLGNSEVFNQSYTFTSSDANAGSGSGGGAGAFWQAAEIDVGDLLISSLAFQEASQPADAIFTTLSGENEITVNIDAPDILQDSDIKIEVTETNDNTDIDVSMHMGRSITWEASHDLPTDLAVESNPIRYEIKAKAEGFELESTPVTIAQDRKSQLRQEYIDKLAVNSNFNKATPSRGDIITSGQYTATANFTFNEFSTYSHFGPGLAIIGESDDIAQTMRDAWGHPIRITSGFRNPRRNDQLGASSFNSFHQTGDAVDLNPSFNSANWPASIACDPSVPLLTTITIVKYTDAQQALTCLAQQQFGASYDILFHAGHLHIELDP